MQWVWEQLEFRGKPFRLAHFEAPGASAREEVSDGQTADLDRAEVELGACLWHDTNRAALRFLERRFPTGCAGRRVLELGAGAGACGLAMAVDGADATLTDVEGLVPLLALNARENGLAAAPSLPPSAPEAPDALEAAPRRARRQPAKKGRRGGDERDSDAEEAAAAAADAAAARGPSAKERRAAREAARAERKARASAPGGAEEGAEEGGAEGAAATGPGEVGGGPPRGRVAAQAAEWGEEARCPRLPAGAFDVVVVCDCLYENRGSWPALQAILERALAPGADLVLASATLRRPFLEEFAAQLEAAGFSCCDRDVCEQAAVLAFQRGEAGE